MLSCAEIVISISRNGLLKSCARFIIELNKTGKKQHDFKSAHFECRMLLFYTSVKKESPPVFQKLYLGDIISVNCIMT